MAWRDSLQRGSFRGAPFEIDSASKRAGRKSVTHEYPQSDRNENEDLGRGPRRFSLELFVVGPDYMSGRDALEAALEAPGPGELVHPYRGRLQVSLDGDYSCTESSREGGMATFSVSFVLDDGVTRPASSIDTQALTQALAADANVAAQDNFAETFSVADAIERESAIDVLQDALGSIAARISEVRIGATSVELRLITALLDPVRGARTVLGDLVGLPADLALMFGGLASNIGRASDLSSLFDRSPSVTVSGSGAAANQDTINRLFRETIAIRRAELTASSEYASYDEAQAAIRIVGDEIDAVSYTADDATFAALQSLRAAVATDVGERAADLARITRYTPSETLPALVIAHRLYGATSVEDNAEELIARNAIVHPGFVSGGVELEVLTP
ncbi:DNA circularization protein [Solimonas flava]|uniref:DNA circularization protein n=1 Tax=Solimonas flava TaxID=415849 RepID=UPI000426BFD4|nr:DNA circularization N-terminal domain-containing protein [Solimonas flava]